jgi:hypothetical protein
MVLLWNHIPVTIAMIHMIQLEEMKWESRGTLDILKTKKNIPLKKYGDIPL